MKIEQCINLKFLMKLGGRGGEDWQKGRGSLLKDTHFTKNAKKQE
jgi:hypothetical protein